MVRALRVLDGVYCPQEPLQTKGLITAMANGKIVRPIRNNLDANEGLTVLISLLNGECKGLYKRLLEEKHLYQSLKIDYDGILKQVREHVIASFHSGFDALVIRADFRAALSQPSDQANLKMNPVNVELFCESDDCQKRQAHRAVWSTEIVGQIQADILVNPKLVVPRYAQIFVVAYRCERCHREPQVLLIRRSGWKFSIEGRSPIEHVEVPRACFKNAF